MKVLRVVLKVLLKMVLAPTLAFLTIINGAFTLATGLAVIVAKILSVLCFIYAVCHISLHDGMAIATGLILCFLFSPFCLQLLLVWLSDLLNSLVEFLTAYFYA